MGILDNYKTEIFSGINDDPIPATVERGSNGSDIVSKLNGICDFFESNVLLRWGNVQFYVDGVNGNDSNKGLAADSAFQTQQKLVEVLATRVIDGVLTVNFANITLTPIDLQFLIVLESSHIIFKGSSDNFSYSILDANTAKLFLNKYVEFKFSLIGCSITCGVSFDFYDFKLLEFKDIKINPLEGLIFSLFYIQNCGELLFLRCFFNTDASSSAMVCCFSVDNIRNLIIDESDLNFYRDYAIYGYDCNLDIRRQNVFTSAPSPNIIPKLNLEGCVAVVAPDLGISKTDTYTFYSKIIFLEAGDLNREVFHFNFVNLPAGSHPLAYMFRTNYKIDRLHVVDQTPTASYNLTIGGQSLTLGFQGAKAKTFSSSDIKNYLEAGGGSLLELVVSEDAVNVSVNVVVFEV